MKADCGAAAGTRLLQFALLAALPPERAARNAISAL